jgi:tRNA nucleotidyltransferase (CCA-adding enzyme)
MELYRKDFTIDTLAIQLNKDYFGQLIDYFNGKLELDKK